jgi:RNase P subunit RPR2
LNRLEQVKELLNKFSINEIAKKLNLKESTIERYARKVKKDPKETKIYTVDSPSILLLDIETLPCEVLTWGLYLQTIPTDNLIKDWSLLGWSAKWLGASKIMSEILTPEEAINRNDKRILNNLWLLMDEAQVIVGHNGCLAPGHKVLKADFTWCNVENLKVGDKILSFNENTPSSKEQKLPRKYEIGKVTACSPIKKECSIIELENGKKIVASNDHPWLVRFSAKHRHWGYKTTEQLKNATTEKVLTKVINMWEFDNSYYAGYLAAFLDGEGCINQQIRKDVYKEKIKNGYQFQLTFSQKDPDIIEKLKESLNYYNFKYTIHPYDKNHIDIMKISLLGGMSEVIRYLGITNAVKKKKINLNSLSQRKMYGIEDIPIKSITSIGETVVIGLSTSTHTYIADGFPCHNSRFDVRKTNARFLLHSFAPPKPYKIIDTLLEARKNFAFVSNKLDHLNSMLDLTRKIKTEYGLWRRCLGMDGADANKALKEMEKYNRQDIVVLEDLYLALRPWIKGHPNLGLYMDIDETMCPNCGSAITSNMKDGSYYTPSGKYTAFRCATCGAIGRSKINELSPKKRRSLLIGAR